MHVPSIYVVIPWRPGETDREIALGLVAKWWHDHHPEWGISIGIWPESRGPWRKACAVHAAGIRPDPGDVVIVSDADVIPEGIGDAVKALASTSHKWAVPFHPVYRLTRAMTRALCIDQRPDGSWTQANKIDMGRWGDLTRTPGAIEERYTGSPGGGTVALTAELYRDVPMDPRFTGYGQEDLSWSLALHRLAGAPARIMAPLWHLWHEPQARIRRGPTLSRGVGSEANLRLWQRYRQATTPTAMRHLMAEAIGSREQIMGGNADQARS